MSLDEQAEQELYNDVYARIEKFLALESVPRPELKKRIIQNLGNALAQYGK